ncbi:MAG: ATP-binding protein [Cyanobacteria bacterium P01_H01_bin.21]
MADNIRSDSSSNISTNLESLLRENAALRQQNEDLAQQTTQLIKTENRLFQLQEDLDQQLRTYQKLSDLGNALNQTFDASQVFSLALEFAIYELGFERCLLFFLNAEQQLCVEAFDGYYDDPFTATLQQLAISWTDLFATHGDQTLLVCDANCTDETLTQWRSQLGMDEYAVAVLHNETQATFGLLVVGNTAEMWKYQTRVDADGNALLGVLNVSNQVAIAISNIRLYNAQQQQNRELEHVVQERTQELYRKNQSLKHTLKKLKSAQAQIIHNEKMLGLGQFVAGFAHEINNSVNTIYANMHLANSYLQNLLALVKSYQEEYPQANAFIDAATEQADLDFLEADLPKLFQSAKDGAERIKNIVLSLKSFSRKDEIAKKRVDIHDGLNSTLMLLEHQLSADSLYPAIEVVKRYGTIPLVECYAAQLNQVFMHLINNGIDALRRPSGQSATPRITITTVLKENWVTISFEDNGPGIPEGIRSKIFEPFFTTKTVGKGPGLGLSNSYQIIHTQHGGRLECHSQLGVGSTFCIVIPLLQTNR